MIIFRDIFTDAELFADSFKMKLFDDAYYEVDGKNVSRKDTIDDSLIGGNASAEACDEGGVEESAQSGIDVVLNHSLTEIPFDKKSYTSYIKKYMKRLAEKIEKDKGKEAADTFREKMKDVVGKRIMGSFKNFQFFVGENFGDEEGMVVLLDYREDGVTPFFIFLKDGLVEEKC